MSEQTPIDARRRLGRKQSGDNNAFRDAWQDAESLMPRSRAIELVEAAAARVRSLVAGRPAAYAWSGGKDSQALRAVAEAAGVDRGVIGLSRQEFPAFEQWVRLNRPPGITPIVTGPDLSWLAGHGRYLFPRNSRDASFWARSVNIRAQDDYCASRSVRVLLLGRRRLDGNYIGPRGADHYESRGVVKVNPIADWSHETVLAVIAHFRLPLPPCYDWPNGWVVGTGGWPARQHTKSVDDGWAKTFAIDPSVVRAAAAVIPSAGSWLDRAGLSRG